MERLIALLKELSEAHGVPGYEGAIAQIIHRKLEPFARVQYDNLGSVVCEKRGTSDSPRIMLAAHMDEIGFIVSAITEEGFLRFQPLGGWWEQVMLAQRVVVKTAKGDVIGVVGSKPPHILEKEERERIVQKKDMFIDVGAASREEAFSFGIRPGDAVVPWALCQQMRNDRLLLGKAWDDRVGCAMMVAVVEELSRTEHPNTVYAVGTVQEEVGCRGAITSSHVVEPDVGLILEVAIATDTPGLKDFEPQCRLGRGPAVVIFDASMIPNAVLRDVVLSVAESEGIPIQFNSMAGGATDGGKIHVHARGVPSLVIGVPTRYIHSHEGIIDLEDFQNAVKLLVATIKRIDAGVLAAIRGRGGRVSGGTDVRDGQAGRSATWPRRRSDRPAGT